MYNSNRKECRFSFFYAAMMHIQVVPLESKKNPEPCHLNKSSVLLAQGFSDSVSIIIFVKKKETVIALELDRIRLCTPYLMK